MKRLGLALTLTALAVAALAPTAKAAFGVQDLDVTFTNANGSPAMQAGSHPFAITSTLNVNVDELTGQPEGAVKDMIVDLPAGLIADPRAVPRCSDADFLQLHESGPLKDQPSCPDASAVGFIAARAPNETVASDFGVAYNLTPPPGVALKIGFRVLSAFITVQGGVRPEGDYHAFAALPNISQAEPFVGATLTLWGNPADPTHDSQRGGCLFPEGGTSCPANIPERAFVTLPRRCSGPLLTSYQLRSWQDPFTWLTGQVESHNDSVPPTPLGTTGCDKLGLSPHIAAQPTTTQASSASGLSFELDIEDDEGLRNPKGIAPSDIKKTVVTMPAGMTLNPSAAEGLTVCSEADLARETLDSLPGQGCPQASKIGEVEVETQLLEGALLKGQLFVATQDENLVHSMIALYLVIKDPGLGILVKLPGKVAASDEHGPNSGRLITTFGEAPYEIPQFPFSHLRFRFSPGPRSSLITPPACGSYTTEAEFTPWSGNGPVTQTASFKITSGPGGGNRPCPPSGPAPFHPGFEAGSLNNSAGSYSPVYMRLTRQDGEQDITRFDSILPPGLTGKIAGVSKCPETAIAAAKQKSGRTELAAPSCPAASQLGHVLAGAGVGSELTYVPGKIYLAGPFGGDPLSVVVITPAVAGPFDVGTVVIREALTLDPNSAEVQVDGANSDRIPNALKGIPLKLRDLRVYVDRAAFTLNATSCDPSAFRATLFGSFVNHFDPADDTPFARASRYQAASCSSLAFKPKLSLRLKGGTKRGSHPALRAVVDYPPGSGYANVSDAVVTLPHSAFLEQSHIRTVCTRIQFASKQCPAGSIYGRARATTPLLDEPLEGPVYLRSSNNPLPDLVVALHGLFDINLVGRIDSVNARIRTSFESAPDAPVSKFVLEMQGGKKGLVVNSRNLCAHKSRAVSQLTGQNGRTYDTTPVVNVKCVKKAKSNRRR